MKTLLTTTLLLATTWAHAGKFEIIGEGIASKPAEFIRVDIAVLAECHQSALQARRSVDALIEKATQALKAYKADIPDQLIVSPEANIQKLKTAYINGQNVVICDQAHSWTSGTTLQFKLNDLKLLANLQDDLLQLNDSSVGPNAVNVERLELSLGKPTPGVLATTWDTMSDLALERAHQNALRQVRVLSLGMTNPKVELTKVTAAATGSSGQLIYDRVDAEGDSSGSGLGLVSVKIARQFTFKVEAQ